MEGGLIGVGCGMELVEVESVEGDMEDVGDVACGGEVGGVGSTGIAG